MAHRYLSYTDHPLVVKDTCIYIWFGANMQASGDMEVRREILATPLIVSRNFLEKLSNSEMCPPYCPGSPGTFLHDPLGPLRNYCSGENGWADLPKSFLHRLSTISLSFSSVSLQASHTLGTETNK